MVPRHPSLGKAEVQVEHIRLIPRWKRLCFNWLKVHPIQAVGVTYQPAPPYVLVLLVSFLLAIVYASSRVRFVEDLLPQVRRCKLTAARPRVWKALGSLNVQCFQANGF